MLRRDLVREVEAGLVEDDQRARQDHVDAAARRHLADDGAERLLDLLQPDLRRRVDRAGAVAEDALGCR